MTLKYRKEGETKNKLYLSLPVDNKYDGDDEDDDTFTKLQWYNC